MGRDDADDVAEDGGWGEMVDHGHDLAEYMLDTTHPYDLHGHKPADRWGTRQQLVSKRFADAGSLADEGRLPTERRSVSSGRTRQAGGGQANRSSPPVVPARNSGAGRTTASKPRPSPARSGSIPSSGPDPSTDRQLMALLRVSPSRKAGKAEKLRRRSELVAKDVGVGPELVSAVVRSTLGTSEVAEVLRMPLERIADIKRAYQRVCDAETYGQIRAAKTPPKPEPTKVKVAPSSQTASSTRRRRSNRPLQPINPIPGCMACGAPIGPNGQCQCS